MVTTAAVASTAMMLNECILLVDEGTVEARGYGVMGKEGRRRDCLSVCCWAGEVERQRNGENNWLIHAKEASNR